MTIEVTQADLGAAWPYRPSCYKDDPNTRARWNEGVYDSAAPVIEAFARHRIATLASALGHENTEAEAMADFAHSNCPTCGGSGHIDDALSTQPAAAEDEVERVALPVDCEDRSVVCEDIAPVIAALNAAINRSRPDGADDIAIRVAQLLYQREKARADHASAVLSAAKGKPISVGMEPWEECAEIYMGDARAAIAAMRPEQQWQPIETAPKDGTRVLLWIEPTRLAMPFAWNGRVWMGDDFPLNMAWATNWMPTPAPPATACAKQGGE